MSYSNGIISAPVSIQDIKTALGSSSNDLATLCLSSNINMWSLMKPCHYDDMWQMKPYGDYGIPDSTDPNKENIVLSGQTKVDVAYGTLGLNFPLLARYDEAANHVTYYTRQLPRGGEHSPYRMGDFVGYSQSAPCPFKLRVSWSEAVATFTINLSTDGNGIRSLQFDYNIYRNVIWRMAVAYAVDNGTNATWNVCVPGTSNDTSVAANGFLAGCSRIQTSFTFSDTFKPSTTYKFSGILIGYKVTRKNEGDDKPITTTISHIWATSIDNSYCAIPMPCDIIVSTSQVTKFKITFGAGEGVMFTPIGSDDDVIMGGGSIISTQATKIDYSIGSGSIGTIENGYAYIPVIFTAGSDSYTVKGFEVLMDADTIAGIGMIPEFTLSPNQSKTIGCYLYIGATGTYSVHITVSNLSIPMTVQNTQTITIKGFN